MWSVTKLICLNQMKVMQNSSENQEKIFRSIQYAHIGTCKYIRILLHIKAAGFSEKKMKFLCWIYSIWGCWVASFPFRWPLPSLEKISNCQYWNFYLFGFFACPCPTWVSNPDQHCKSTGCLHLKHILVKFEGHMA